MSEIRIADAKLVTSLKNSDKLPISSGDGQAHSVSMELLKNFCGGLTRVSWNDITGKPDFKPVATTGNYNDLNQLPTIPSKTSDLNNDSQFTTTEEVNKTIDLKGFITKKEANTTFVATPKVTQIEAQAVVQIEVQSNSTYLVDCSSGITERIEIMNFAGDLNSVKIYIKRVGKPIQIVYPKSAVFLTPKEGAMMVRERREVVIELNLNYVKYFESVEEVL